MNTLNSNLFFKPTPTYIEHMILNEIIIRDNTTQRELSVKVGVSVSMINEYLNDYVAKGYIKKIKYTTKTVDYVITSKGRERHNLLNILYLQSSQKIYLSAKEYVLEFIAKVREEGYKKVLLYGAGEVADVFLTVVKDCETGIEVVAIIDDDPEKIGRQLKKIKIISLDEIYKNEHDGILIGSYKHYKNMLKNLKHINYPTEKLLEFLK